MSFPAGEERTDDNVCYKYPHRIGNNILICGKKNSAFPFHCMVGPEWPCMVFTYLLIAVPTFYFLKNVASTWGAGLVAVCSISGIIVICLFSATACSDPGIVYIPKATDKSDNDPAQLSGLQNTMECGRCQLQRPRTATHCYECGVCVDQLDHHCPWTGKCIAKKNFYTFRVFLGFLMMHLVLIFGVCIYTIAHHKPII